MPLKKWSAPLLAVFVAVPAMGEIQTRAINEQTDQVTRWNRFVDKLFTLHLKRISGREIRTTEKVGGYHRYPEFYNEITYIDAKSDLPLSAIRWLRENPGERNKDREDIHQIQAYIYDKQGRVTRDYSATYLPEFRNAPIQTLVTLHHYADELHGFRVFDASDNRIYEVCRGRHEGSKVDIGLDEDEMALYQHQPDSVMHSEVYQKCFGDIALSAGDLVEPQ
jgi:hypothetical protein